MIKRKQIDKLRQEALDLMSLYLKCEHEDEKEELLAKYSELEQLIEQGDAAASRTEEQEFFAVYGGKFDSEDREDPSSDQQAPSRYTSIEELEVLSGLRDRGTISHDEYDDLKNRILMPDNAKGRDPLHKLIDAIDNGDLHRARELIERYPEIVNLRTPKQGLAPLHVAVSKPDPEAVTLLLEMGADPDAKSKGGKTALHFAAGTGDKVLAQMLLDHGADTGVTYKGQTAYERAYATGYEDLALLIANHREEATPGPSGN